MSIRPNVYHIIHYLHPWMSSMNDAPPSMDDIYRWHYHLGMRFAHPWVALLSVRFCSCVIYEVLGQFWLKSLWSKCERWKFHTWMNKSHHRWKWHPWLSSMDGKKSSMDESAIHECHPWMKMTDEEHGGSHRGWYSQFFLVWELKGVNVKWRKLILF